MTAQIENLRTAAKAAQMAKNHMALYLAQLPDEAWTDSYRAWAKGAQKHLAKAIYYIETVRQWEVENCQHEHTTIETCGGEHFDGEYWDDIERQVRCLDCGAVLKTENGTETEEIPY